MLTQLLGIRDTIKLDCFILSAVRDGAEEVQCYTADQEEFAYKEHRRVSAMGAWDRVTLFHITEGRVVANSQAR